MADVTTKWHDDYPREIVLRVFIYDDCINQGLSSGGVHTTPPQGLAGAGWRLVSLFPATGPPRVDQGTVPLLGT